MADELASLAFAVSQDGLRQQATVLDELRSRSATLLTASSIVASFLGSQALERSSFGWSGTAALVSFVLSILGCLWILLPHSGLIFSISGPTLYEQEFGHPIDEVHRRLAYWCEDFQVNNLRTIGRLFVAYRIAALAVIFQTLFWALHFV